MRRCPRRRAALLLLLALLPSTSGCGVLALIHDKMLGPVSPLGEIHPPTIGAEFTVTDQGVSGDISQEPNFRPFPPNIPDRGRPLRYWNIVQGLSAFIRGISFVVWGETQDGRPLDPAMLDGLRPGVDAQTVLSTLGTPQMWLRRKTGSLMAYKAELGTFFAFYVGMPPFVDNINPIPGLSSLTFRWNYQSVRPYKTVLFFDQDDRLVTWMRNDPDQPIEETVAASEEGE